MNLHSMFEVIRAISQETGNKDHVTSLIKMQKEFAMLPDHLRQEFLDWANGHKDAHLIDLLDPPPPAPPQIRLRRSYSFISLQRDKTT